MPRGGGGSRGGSRSPPPRSSTTASKPQPQPQKTTVPPQQVSQPQSGGMLSGIGSTIMQGMAFGAGSEVAHQAIRSLMGGSSHNQQQVAQQPQQAPQQYTNPCQMEITNFSSCLQANDDVSYCQSYSDMLKQCKKNNNLL